MGVRRRDSVRGIDQSVERMWRVYADEMGIPDTGSGEAKEPLPGQPNNATLQRRPVRRRRWRAGLILTTVAVVLVAICSALALRQRLPISAESVERPSRTLVSPPTADETTGAPKAGAQVAGTSNLHRKDLLYRVSFDFGSDRISDDSKASLNKIIVSMKANSDWYLLIEGHADAYGSPDHNQSLSERRAEAIKRYLHSSGIAPERLSAIGFGASRPAAPNDAAGNALNRRAEIYRR